MGLAPTVPMGLNIIILGISGPVSRVGGERVGKCKVVDCEAENEIAFLISFSIVFRRVLGRSMFFLYDNVALDIGKLQLPSNWCW